MKINKSTRIILYGLAAGIVVFIFIQIIPYGHQMTNPPVTNEPAWDSTKTRELVKQSCFDCHSNETTHPWYSLAPASWLLQYDVDKGRQSLNFSEWDTSGLSGDYLIQNLNNGEMPPSRYLLLHPEAKLTPSDKELLIQGILASIK